MRGSTPYAVLIGLSAILLSVLGFWSIAREGYVERIEAIEAGFYKLYITGNNHRAPNTAAGVVHEVAGLELLKEEPAKSAVVGTRFGVKFRLVSSQPAIEIAKLRAVWKMPAPGIMNPKNGTIFREDVADFDMMLGAQGYRGYGFDEDWEAVPGEWILQIWQGDRMLLERRFMIK